ncbi:acyl carrier protein [Lentzea sp. NPDC058436]|uniref:acyl carrier protein n=1 Tax=Lentzea sp. NPDC058436 TaxID=3346499 RepID=UPI00364CD972
MPQREVLTVVESFVRDISSETVEVASAARLDDIGLDSLSIVDLLFKLERTFDVSIPDEALPTLTTVGALVEYVTSEKAGSL